MQRVQQWRLCASRYWRESPSARWEEGHPHDHLLAAQERVSDEFARAQSHLAFGHVGGVVGGCRSRGISARLRWKQCRRQIEMWATFAKSMPEAAIEIQCGACLDFYSTRFVFHIPSSRGLPTLPIIRSATGDAEAESTIIPAVER